VNVLPISPEQSSLVILDLLFKLKIKEVMTTTLITAPRGASLRDIQRLMKENGITGVPIAEGRRLFGIVSMDDIITALENGTVDERADRHMATNLVVLEDDMPLSFGISYFDKFRYGRFPVLNRNNELVGILTSRDVSASLLLELFKEYNKLEAQIQPPAPAAGERGRVRRKFPAKRYDFENAGKASHEIKKELTGRGYDPRLIRRVSVAAYEMELNMVVHSEGGALTCLLDPDRVELIAQDHGPGIADVDWAMQEGCTTANEWIKSLGFGAGMGLPNIRRVADEFDIQSTVGVGTTVRAVIRLPPVAPSPAPPQTP